ncbi:hypothetical protein IQ265_09580 [Nodosilinea sp. LEGE 06152]|uniref:hypothetical protein n=1 Tax=Nodosilinea sp. LEGE 06152 TaxID=2777966 RepID=UPI0018815547|nr:hypothetical protein [Nodosilinea sp. LEGE 06152]MBE9157074.1 hypothetical protein [Nodosilinea sp. LEGE 06152]
MVFRAALLGQAWQKYRSQSPRMQWGIPFAAAALGGIALTIYLPYRSSQSPPAPRVPGAYDFTGTDPLTLAGMMGSEEPEAVANALIQILPAYDLWLQDQMAKTLDYPIAKETERLLGEARKEVATASLDTKDSVGDIDLSGCVETLEPVQCILLRYAGDGIRQMNDALQTNDAYALTQGLVRYHAAIRGVFPQEYVRFDGSELTRGLTGQRFAIMRLKEYQPAARSPVNPLLINPRTTPPDLIKESME